MLKFFFRSYGFMIGLFSNLLLEYDYIIFRYDFKEFL